MKIEIELPEGVSMGDLTAAGGAVLKASAAFVDWDDLYNGTGQAISSEGRILIAIATQLTKEGS
jgi:hypothetical protein